MANGEWNGVGSLARQFQTTLVDENGPAAGKPWPARPTKPDQPAYLVLVMDVLADLARQLGREEEAEAWRQRAEAMQEALFAELWMGDRFVGRLKPSGTVVACDSLLVCMPMVLGRRLPDAVRQGLLARIREHLTEHGLATEKPGCPNYVEGGYWRGPIWAPSTMLITSGLDVIGEHELSRTIKRAFCELCRNAGFYENFDPITGQGYYDTAYTWTSSVFMIFASQLFRETDSANRGNG